MNPTDFETQNSQTPERVRGIPWQEFESGLILLQTRSSMVHELNETAAWLWMQSEGQMNLRQLADKMSEEFDVSPETAQQDILEMIQDLISKGLMKWK